MSDHKADPGAGPRAAAEKAAAEQAKAEAKMAKARAEKEAKHAEERAEDIEEKAQEEERKEKAQAATEQKPKATQSKKAEAKPAKAEAKSEKAEAKPEKAEPEIEVVEEQDYVAKAKPELDDDLKIALQQRAAKKDKTPKFRRHEWWRYKKLGGKHASWRRPAGIHSKARRHFKYRPNVVSIGFRGPAAARGLHPSGFQDVLVHTPSELERMDPKTQAARIGGTVGGRKAELIQKEADKLGIRILNRRS